LSKVIERKWLEPHGTSFLILREEKSHNPKHYPDEYELLMHDCNRQCHWMFPKDARGRAKLAKIKAVIERLEKELNA
jgi:hypothetical protein